MNAGLHQRSVEAMFTAGGLYGSNMLRPIVLLAALASLAACATTPPARPGPQAPITRPPLADPRDLPPPQMVRADRPLQCVPYARQRSGVLIFGDANTWMSQAQGRYRIVQRPQPGAVMVLGGTPGGHLAVVTKVVSDREVLVDHANWANDGAIHLNAPIVDVAGDWSAVRVWHMQSGQLGARAYPVLGFILAP